MESWELYIKELMDEEQTLTGMVPTVPMPLGMLRREMPGSRSMSLPRIIPLAYMSRNGRNRRKQHKRKNRGNYKIHFTDMA